MNPYRDSIPYDQGQDIEEKVRERDNIAEDDPLPKRRRADTDALVPPHILRGASDEVPPAPIEIEKYDQDRLQHGLAYIAIARRRNITPRTKTFLKLYTDAYKAALESPSLAANSVVKAMDEVYCHSTFFFKAVEPDKQKQIDDLLKLKRLEFLANYGDYFGEQSQRIRARLNKLPDTTADDAVYDTELGPPNVRLDFSRKWKGDRGREVRESVSTCCIISGLNTDHIHY